MQNSGRLHKGSNVSNDAVIPNILQPLKVHLHTNRRAKVNHRRKRLQLVADHVYKCPRCVHLIDEGFDKGGRAHVSSHCLALRDVDYAISMLIE